MNKQEFAQNALRNAMIALGTEEEALEGMNYQDMSFFLLSVARGHSLDSHKEITEDATDIRADDDDDDDELITPMFPGELPPRRPAFRFEYEATIHEGVIVGIEVNGETYEGRILARKPNTHRYLVKMLPPFADKFLDPGNKYALATYEFPDLADETER